MMNPQSVLWALAAMVVGIMAGHPLGSLAKRETIDSGWSQKGRDSVSIALYIGAVSGMSTGFATASHDLPSAIVRSLLGGMAMGFALSFRYIFDGLWDASASNGDSGDRHPDGSEPEKDGEASDEGDE